MCECVFSFFKKYTLQIWKCLVNILLTELPKAVDLKHMLTYNLGIFFFFFLIWILIQ